MIEPVTRKLLPEDFRLTDWASLQPWLAALEERNITDESALETWLRDWSEVEAVVAEDACWRQIKMTCDTTDPALEEAFQYFCLEIEPRLKPFINRLQQKLVQSPFLSSLAPDLYFPFIRGVENALSLFREENIPLQADLNILAQQYGTVSAKWTVVIDDKEYTLQQAAKLLEEPDRDLRKTAFTKISERRLEDQEALDALFDELLAKRHQVALNAGFENYRDYKFRELGRFDYTPEDCFAFHEAVREHIVPLQARLLAFRKRKLGLEQLRPYDTAAVAEGEQPLQPFRDGAELLVKSAAVFDRLQPFYGDCLRTMSAMGRMDLDSSKGKAPGGYNCPLPETGVPFIFMNAAGTTDDVITMMHEGGHAVHSFLAHKLPLTALKEYPMEIAELASMSMELFSMEHWEVFFEKPDDLLRAKQEELERVIDVLPWIATIDKFQHWLYTHPGHDREQRRQAWLAIMQEFSTGVTDWEGLEQYQQYYWQKQLHLFEVPFYYIEYGIAQLGAVAMWRQYKQDKAGALANYNKALSLGYTRTLPELYETAGIRFSFATGYIIELKSFLEKELELAGM